MKLSSWKVLALAIIDDLGAIVVIALFYSKGIAWTYLSAAIAIFVSSLSLLGDLKIPMVKYLAMFRPQNRDLTFERAAKLLTEIAPDFVAKQIKRGHHTYPAPTGAWGWAIGVLLERRDQNKIDLPLKTHGYLYEVITSYKPDQHAAPMIS